MINSACLTIDSVLPGIKGKRVHKETIPKILSLSLSLSEVMFDAKGM
jgi:hypothetical protein